MTFVWHYNTSLLGNFGYAEDETLSSSSTLPMYPVIDDQNYGHMPWYDHKPVIFLESEWENCQYRMESLNLLINTANIVVMSTHSLICEEEGAPTLYD